MAKSRSLTETSLQKHTCTRIFFMPLSFCQIKIDSEVETSFQHVYLFFEIRKTNIKMKPIPFLVFLKPDLRLLLEAKRGLTLARLMSRIPIYKVHKKMFLVQQMFSVIILDFVKINGERDNIFFFFRLFIKKMRCRHAITFIWGCTQSIYFHQSIVLEQKY